ncbi:MAG TPA: hypothetical protein VML75_01830 [Kofleriaceae bacterium]|nr:hypothetical protein [Kofleriaceae bacterium]
MQTAPISTPRFRTDLVAQPIDSEGQRFVDVTDPDSGRTFRFYEVEYSIACAMNGQRSLGSLANWALEELGLETTTDELETVISTLDELGYLDGPLEVGAVELGQAGGTVRRAASAAPLPADDLELGAPGRSSIARERPAPPPVEAVELGMPGGLRETPEVRAVTSPGSEDDMSFEGLMEQTGTRPVPASLSRDDVPTAVRAQPPRAELYDDGDDSDFGLEGLTPPPAEVPSATLRPSTEPASDDDGPTNLPPPAPGLEEEEVSVDLSEHLSIGSDDLKEAVRQSRVMQAVAVPPELLAELEGEPPDDAATQSPAPFEVEDRTSEPIELPSKRAAVSKAEPTTPVEPPPQREEPTSSVGILIVVFVIVLFGGAAAYYYLGYLPNQDEGGASSPSVSDRSGKAPVVAPTPLPPEPPSATLVSSQGANATLTMPEPSGAVEWLAEDGARVAKGDAVVHLKGYAALEKKANAYDVRGMQYQEKLERAAAALEKAAEEQKPRHQKAVESYEAKVVEKAELAKAMRDKLDGLTMSAPTAGTVKALGRPGAWIKAGEPLLEIGTEPVLSASFTLPAEAAANVGDSLSVTTKSARDATIECTVTAVEGARVTVQCPPESLKAGTEIVLK